MQSLFRTTSFVLGASLVIACSSGSSDNENKTDAPSDTSDTNGNISNPQNTSNRWKIDSYRGRTVDSENQYGLWALIGSEDVNITSDQDSDNGSLDRRMIFTIRPGESANENQIRLCGYVDSWLPLNTSTQEISYRDDDAILLYEFEPINTDLVTENQKKGEMSITLNFSLNDPESSTQTNVIGRYTAVKISDSTDVDLGNLTLNAQVIDYSEFSNGITKKTILAGDSVEVECLNETTSPFIGTLDNSGASDIFGIGDVLDQFKRNDILQLSFAENYLRLQTIQSNTGSKGYISHLAYGSDYLISITGSDGSHYDYEAEAFILSGEMSTTNHLEETASAQFDLNY